MTDAILQWITAALRIEPFFGIKVVVRAEVDPEYEGWIKVHFTLKGVKHRETGEPTGVTLFEYFHLDDFKREDVLDYFAFRCRSAFQRLVLHEVDECFYIGGRRYFNPHPG